MEWKKNSARLLVAGPLCWAVSMAVFFPHTRHLEIHEALALAGGGLSLSLAGLTHYKRLPLTRILTGIALASFGYALFNHLLDSAALTLATLICASILAPLLFRTVRALTNQQEAVRLHTELEQRRDEAQTLGRAAASLCVAAWVLIVLARPDSTQSIAIGVGLAQLMTLLILGWWMSLVRGNKWPRSARADQHATSIRIGCNPVNASHPLGVRDAASAGLTSTVPRPERTAQSGR